MRGRRLARWLVGRWMGRPVPGARPRVTILLGSAWGMGGTIRSVIRVAGRLAERHDVLIVSVLRRRDTPFFAFPPGVRVVALDDQRAGAVPLVVRPVRAALGRLPSLLVPRVVRTPAYTVWTDVRLLLALRGRAGVLIGTRASLTLAAARLASGPMAVIGEEHLNLGAHTPPVVRAMQRSLRRLDALVVLTEADRRAFSRLLPGMAIEVIPNAVSADTARAPLAGTTILAAGRLTRQKGFDLLLPAFARFCERQPGWRLRICGDGPQRARLEHQADELGIGDRVAFPGAVRQLEQEMRRASMFVLSSRLEGFPVVLLEAMATGLPVVAFDCPTGPGELVEDRHNGVLVPARDVAALAAAMLELAQDRELQARLADAAAATAATYSMDAIGPRWDALLQRVAAAHAAPEDGR